VVATKLHIPPPRPERLPRPELVALLRDAPRARLVLVSAPAGAGKTTLLAGWHADPLERRPFAWLSLDPDDNDPVRFWSCVLAAVRTVRPDFGADVAAALRAPGSGVTELALPLLVNALAALHEPVVLALDDYHVVSNEEVHRSLEFLIEHLPATAVLAVASRADPPLPLARLRARSELVEVRAADLRLTDEQAAALLNVGLGLDLGEDEISRLRVRTEGWAAGLQLVGLSLRGRADRRSYIESFAGDDRQIVDYLASEVLERQPAATRAFLLRTSVLDQLSGPLCDAVTGGGGSAAQLESLERENLFVIPLDARREWYRYHHLFRDLLRHGLGLEEPGLVAELHRRAYSWFRAAGLAPQAIAHATAAGDVAVAAELIAASWLEYVNRGELETVEAWTRALPPGAAEADPRLCIARAWMLLVLGRPEEVEASVRAAERGVLPGPIQDGSRSVEASAALVRTSARLLLGDVGGAAETAVLAARLEPDREAPWRAIVTNAIGMTAFWSGRSGEAVDAFGETVSSGARVGNHTARIYAFGYLAAIAGERGRLGECDRLVEEARELARRQFLGEHWVAAMVELAAGEAALARADHDAAEAALARGLELARRGGLRLDTAYGLRALARLRREQGRARDAEELVDLVRRELAGCADPGILREEAGGPSRVARAPARPAPAGQAEPLSVRELAVLRLLPTRLSLREIGGELYVSLNTVKTHARAIYRKLGATSREDAVSRARTRGLL